MNSTLKTAGVLGLFMAVVFGATVIKQYTGRPSDTDGTTTDDAPTQPVRLISEREAFQGFYEKGNHLSADFWIQNITTDPVQIAALARSCTACSSAQVGIVPPEAMKEFETQSAAISTLAATGLMQKIQWKNLDFDAKPPIPVVLPPAPSKDVPSFAILRLGIDVNAVGETMRHVDFGFRTDRMVTPAVVKYVVRFHGMSPFAVTPPEINLGEMAEGQADRTFTAHYWSATRSQDQLPAPGTSLSTGSSDPFVSIGKPEPMTEAERTALATQLTAGDEKKPVTVIGGYKIPITVRRQVPGATPSPEPDIGPFERAIGVSGPGSDSAKVTLKGTVIGLVSLADSASVAKLGHFNAKFGTSKDFKLFAEREGLELELIPAENDPPSLKTTLNGPVTENGRRIWTLKIAVPENAVLGDLPPDAAVVLRAKGPAGQKIRVPVSGTGFSR